MDGILKVWSEYFNDLYSVSEDEEFDNEYRRIIETITTHFTNP